jgi:hypothetical protein
MTRAIKAASEEQIMRVRELLQQLKDAPGDALICIAEVDEAFASNIASVETVENARLDGRAEEGTEAVELGQGKEKAVVLRW